MDMMLWHEKAGDRYMYYVLSLDLVWLLERILPPALRLSLTLSQRCTIPTELLRRRAGAG